MRVLVVGVGKSGTTALLYAIRAAMPAHTQMLFEPHAPAPAIDQEHVLAKVLLNPRDQLGETFYRSFDKTILIVRDPRDVVISKALYRVYNVPAMYQDDAKLAQYLQTLKAKERDPRSLSLCELNRTFRRLLAKPAGQDEGLVALLDNAMQFHDRHPQCLAYYYEQMIRGDFQPVATYLGLPMNSQQGEVPDDLRRVIRSRRSGNWRDWFCAEDVEHYRPLLQPYLTRYGYNDDWDLSPTPTIRPEEASTYVTQLAKEARRQ